MKKPRHLWEETFKMTYLFMVGWSQEEASSFFKKEYDHETSFNTCDGKTFELENSDGIRAIVIWVRKKNMLPELAHEVCHAALFTFEAIGLEHIEQTDQAYCLLVERLFRFARENT